MNGDSSKLNIIISFIDSILWHYPVKNIFQKFFFINYRNISTLEIFISEFHSLDDSDDEIIKKNIKKMSKKLKMDVFEQGMDDKELLKNYSIELTGWIRYNQRWYIDRAFKTTKNKEYHDIMLLIKNAYSSEEYQSYEIILLIYSAISICFKRPTFQMILTIMNFIDTKYFKPLNKTIKYKIAL